MELTKNERLILINQYTILKHLDAIDPDTYNKFVEILENGYEIYYSYFDDQVYGNFPKTESSFVLDALDMLFHMQQVTINHDTLFHGFDGNYETDYMGYAQYVLNTDEGFPSLRRDDNNNNCNSHMQKVGKYKIWVMEWKNSADMYNLTQSDVDRIVSSY